jgi:hypothetical protein
MFHRNVVRAPPAGDGQLVKAIMVIQNIIGTHDAKGVSVHVRGQEVSSLPKEHRIQS